MPSNKKYFICIIFILLLISNLACAQDSETKYKKERDWMVKIQIENRGIKDTTVLSAMKDVPRHIFVPKLYRMFSYEDRPLPIGYGQTISQPYIVALMTELLKLNKDSKALEVGTGSGYQAAILSKIAKKVYTIEIIEELHIKTNKVLEKAGYDTIKTKFGDGYYGWEECAPYDAIIVTCAAEFVPPPLIKQLKIGGIMCIPVGPPFRVQNLLVITKKSEELLETKVITQVRFVPLIRK
ncbi:MAG: protein-L-isoaspartate(D-aspartate) O-methyltransferase [Candidatus Cloacimonetes bacterium]|nr:protein-L-isoaspartate(D-aspartate) O-methyltransferase [Candidatus Cloacimonadota bacterium]